MKIFNKNNNLEKIVNTLNEQYIAIQNIDEKINQHINHLTKLNTPISSIEPEIRDTNDCAKEIIDENMNYKKQIEKLTKDVTFHEGRSNKNFEEVKRLRALVDSISSEKRGLEKKVASLENELELSKNAENSNMDIESINKIKEENQLLLEKVNSFERTKERLNKEIEFQKNRSKTNWEDLKTLKIEYNKLLEENKKNAESKNTLKEKDLKELQSLRNIKKVICSNERGATFWRGVSDAIGEVDDYERIENVQTKTNASYNLTIAGITKTRVEWRKEWDIPKSRLRYRIEQKWDNLEILFGKDFKYSDAKKFYTKYPDAILYDTLDDEIKNKIKDKLKLEEPIIDNTLAKDGFNHLYTDECNLYVEKLLEDKYLLCILETIGKTGLSRVIELKETDNFKKTFVTATGSFSQGTLCKKINELNDLCIIDVEQINTGRKGGYENIYCLSDLGKQIYKLIFSENPIESEKESISRQYNSLEHGYFTKTAAKEFTNKGYKVNKIVDINLDTPIEADLIITKDDTDYIVLCEIGDTTEDSLSDKLDRLIRTTNTISFIMNNQESLNKISSKVDKWITKKGREKLKDCTFRFTTIDTLKKKEVWQNKGPF